MYTVKVSTSNDKGVMDSLMRHWDHLTGHWDSDGLVLSAHSAYYESPDHFASSLNSIFDSNGIDARASAVVQ